MKEIQKENLISRSPIVVVLGHVDHGKTSLLDYIRRTNVIAKEAGGITQSIGAYEITHHNKRITFIDTPGHEVFSKMRERGARAADLGILVVAADEGVKPQTKEAIEILNQTKTSFIVAINKIDKPNADIERTKMELMQAGVLLEGFGGNISWQGISAKTGEGVNELLDLILLAAELENLTYNPEAKASGIIIESKIDRRRGITASVIVKDGVLKTGDEIATPSAFGKVKILENFLGERVNEIIPSAPALVLGFEALPQVGEEFISGKIETELLKIEKEKKEISVQPEEGLLNLILKADVSGSLEALSEVIKTFPKVRVIAQAVGDITDGDVKLALTGKAIVVGFRSRVSQPAENLAKSTGVKIIASEIIYELLKNLEIELKAVEAPVINGKLEILGVFGKKNGRQIIGGRVLAGVFKNNLNVNVQRGEQIIGEGKIINLQKEKRDVSQVSEEEECGMLFESNVVININDILIY